MVEFSKKLAAGDYEEMISGMSQETQNMFNEYKNGNATVSDVMTSVQSEMKKMSPAEQQKMLTVLGSQFEDIGVKGFLGLNKVGATNFHSSAGSSRGFSVTGNGTICSDQSRSRAVLFRRHQRQPVAIGVRPRTLDLALRIGMMVGEGAAAHHIDTVRLQRIEEPFRDRRCRRTPGRACRRATRAAPGPASDAHATPACPCHHLPCERIGGRAITDDHQRIGARELRLQRGAERPGWRTPARCRGRGGCRSRSATYP